MGVWSSNVNRPAEPARAITSLFPEFERRSNSGEVVTVHRALGVPTAWRCVALVAELLSSLPVDVYRGTGPNKTVVSEQPDIITSPSLRVERRDWIYQYVASMMLRGSAKGYVMAVGPNSLPTAVEWMDPTSLTVEALTSLALPTYRLDGQEVPRERVVHINNFVLPGCVDGLSPIEYHAETLGMSIAARKFGAQWFGDGAHPSAILSTDSKVDPESATAIKTRFMAALKGRREPAVLGSGMKYTAIQVSAEESQFLQTIGATDSQVAQILGVPGEMLGIANSGAGDGTLTYANRESRWADFIATCLNHYAVRLESAWSAMLPPNEVAKFALDALLRGDTEARFRSHAIALTNGFETLNEVRALEDLPLLPEAAETDPEVVAALNLAEKAPSLVQDPGLPALVDQLRILNGKPPKNPTPVAPDDGTDE